MNPYPKQSISIPPPRGRKPQGLWGRLKSWWRRSRLAKMWWQVGDRLYRWWYPPPTISGNPADYVVRSGSNRPTKAWRRLQQWVRRSPLVRAYSAMLNRLYQWWYPPTDQPTSYYGYYGSGRLSRATIVWRKLKRGIYHSGPGKRCAKFFAKLNSWWYFPQKDAGVHKPHYEPLKTIRRGWRWLRETRAGRKLGLGFYESAHLASFVQHRLARAFVWQRLRKYLWRWQTVAALFILAGMGWVAYKQGLPRYRRFIEKQYSRQAREFMVKRDFARAYLRARQSLAINTKNPDATQIIADLSDMSDSPYAIYWRQRVELLAPTVTNQFALASTALKFEQFPYSTTVKTLDEITPENRSTVTYHLIAGALAVKLDNLNEAEQNYAAAVKLQPDDPASRMSLAVVQLQSQNPRIIADARTTLEALGTEGKLGLLPLRSLVAESMLRQDFDRAERLSSVLLTNTQASFDDRMLHLAILHAAHRTYFQAFLNDTEQRASQNPIYIGELATWLNQFGYATEALAWLQGLPDPVRREELVPLALADSYTSLKRWNDLESYLENEHWPGMEYIRIAMLAFAIRNESENVDYDTAWQRAVGLASKSPASLNLLAQLAASWGWKAEAEQVLWQAVDNFPNQDWPLVQLNDFYTAQRDTKNMRRIFQIELQRHPADKFAKNNYAMLSLLLGEDTWTAHQYAAELHASAPDNPTFTSTYAFSLYLQGKTKQGIAVLRSLKPEDLSRPGTAAYYGVLLAADGQIQAAKDCFARSADAFLLPEEMALVRSAKKALPEE